MRLPLGALGVLVVLSCAECSDPAVTDDDSASSCVGPYLDDQPPSGTFRAPTPTVAPGDQLTIYGHWCTDTCNDTGDGGSSMPMPMPMVRLTLTLPDGAVEEHGQFEPHGRDMGFSTDVSVPRACCSLPTCGPVADQPDLHGADALRATQCSLS